jgi:5-formyltetrahydrofolate cyclo-ligase
MTLIPLLEKTDYRHLYTLARSHIGPAYAEKAAETIAKRFLKDIPLPEGTVIAAYMPHGHELSLLPLLAQLHQLGYVCAVPSMVGNEQPLVFRSWQPNMALVVDPVYGINEPDAECARVEPDIILTPLLACTVKGVRLGYGKGYYDRTVKELRSQKKVLVIGACFSCQVADILPAEVWDEKLDRVITEKGMYHCA